MRSVGHGDLALTYRNILQNARIKEEIATLSDELSSGRQSDLKVATKGDLGGYAGIEATLQQLSSYRTTAHEAALFTQTVQMSLGEIQDLTAELAPELINAGSSQLSATIDPIVSEAHSKFNTITSLLNSTVAGRALFAGANVDGAALAGFDTIMSSLSTAIAAETTASGVIGVVNTWFGAGGGFETVAYQGGTGDLAPFRVGANETATLQLRADDQVLRDVMKGYALASLVHQGALSSDPDERIALVAEAGLQLINANEGLSYLRGNVGTVEGQIDTAIARNAAETAALEIARSDIVSADPYKTATELQTAETQLETLYAITARLSRLSLVDYLR